ncbi:MAG: response regulator transcription factor [Synechococcaceae cyanobacterium]|nr:response regulator transcription factor [Synechococcaceae cyanobacterium]
MDLLPDRALLEARRDLLLVLLRDRNLLVAVFPRLLALSLAFRTDPGSTPPPLRRLEITSSRGAALAVLDRCPQEPFHLLVSEHLADGPGLDLVAAVRRRSLEHRCVLLLTHNHRVLVEAAVASGADAVVLEESLGRTGALVHAVEQLGRGRRFIDPACALAGESAGEDGAAAAEALTAREVEVLRLVAQGCSNREIGEQLHIAASTARDHVQDILRRLGVRSRAAAAVAGVRLGYCR